MKALMRVLDIRPVPAPLPQEDGGKSCWVCAEAQDGRLLAALQLQPAIGHSRPRYSFHLGRVVHAAPDLGLHQVQTTLQLGHDATGEAELSGLYLAPELAGCEAGDALLDELLQQALATLDAMVSAAGQFDEQQPLLGRPGAPLPAGRHRRGRYRCRNHAARALRPGPGHPPGRHAAAPADPRHLSAARRTAGPGSLRRDAHGLAAGPAPRRLRRLAALPGRRRRTRDGLGAARLKATNCAASAGRTPLAVQSSTDRCTTAARRARRRGCRPSGSQGSS